MKKTQVRLFFGVLVLAAGLLLTMTRLDALGDNACRGTDGCDAIEQACLEGEYLRHWKTSSTCISWYECQTTFRVLCIDKDEDDFYTRYAHCYAPAGSEECGGHY